MVWSGVDDNEAILAGDLELTLVRSDTDPDNFLPISNGRLTGTARDPADPADPGIPFMADLEGALDCPGRRLMAQMVNGHAMVIFFDLPFHGEFTGTYVPLEHSFVDGALEGQDIGMLNASGITMGYSGTWNASFAGP
jgi:hypothetical protein